MTDPPASDSPTQGGSDAILTEPASEGPILTEAEVLDLQEEETRLYAARAVIERRLAEVTRALVRSGEARLRARLRALQAAEGSGRALAEAQAPAAEGRARPGATLGPSDPSDPSGPSDPPPGVGQAVEYRAVPAGADPEACEWRPGVFLGWERPAGAPLLARVRPHPGGPGSGPGVVRPGCLRMPAPGGPWSRLARPAPPALAEHPPAGSFRRGPGYRGP
jgi:hypothetical protein